MSTGLLDKDGVNLSRFVGRQDLQPRTMFQISALGMVQLTEEQMRLVVLAYLTYEFSENERQKRN